MCEYRLERDSMGQVQVPADKLWGAQTQRSFQNFKIGEEKMPMDIIYAFGLLKKAAALTNQKLGRLDDARSCAIGTACDEILSHQLDEHFPLRVWQTGSGTQSNMNVNEVIAHRAAEICKEEVHPNDHVNMSQSSNDTFPTAMHIAAALAISEELLPALERLITILLCLEAENKDVIKIGRTHLQDAVPITLGQEISGWRASLEQDRRQIRCALQGLYTLALGGTAVGTGLNAPPDFSQEVANTIGALTGKPFTTAPNKFHALTSRDELVFAHGAMKALAGDLMKIANDVRWLASGPRCGLGEITIPANEPGSSIMPGKVNPTQCEAVTMVCVQVMGNDVTIGIAASQGNFELNVFMPVMAYNFQQSVRLLTDCMESFRNHCLNGLTANRERCQENLYNSLMLVTALNPYIGYEKAAKTAQEAFQRNISLKEACVLLGFLSAEEFDRLVVPENMV